MQRGMESLTIILFIIYHDDHCLKPKFFGKTKINKKDVRGSYKINIMYTQAWHTIIIITQVKTIPIASTE